MFEVAAKVLSIIAEETYCKALQQSTVSVPSESDDGHHVKILFTDALRCLVAPDADDSLAAFSNNRTSITSETFTSSNLQKQGVHTTTFLQSTSWANA